MRFEFHNLNPLVVRIKFSACSEIFNVSILVINFTDYCVIVLVLFYCNQRQRILEIQKLSFLGFCNNYSGNSFM